MKLERKYVVIGADSVRRTHLGTEDEATQHARNLIINQGQLPGTELWVVEIKRVVRVLQPQPPIEIQVVD